MCGIIGVLASRPATPIILDALQRLEYRGYDSAGIAAIEHGRISRRRASGKLTSLATLLEAQPLSGLSGIGHTRWATHGRPDEANAHPHQCDTVVIVHNGIIENYLDLRAELIAEGFTFESETDSEVIAAVCASMLRRGLGYEDAVAATLSRLEGAYALCAMFEGEEDVLVCARRGSPLIVGIGEHEAYVGSDAVALAPLTNRILYLEEGDWAVVKRDSIVVHDSQGRMVERKIHEVAIENLVADKGQHRHFMAKEIHEQPAVAARALGSWIACGRRTVASPAAAVDWSTVSRLTIVACGTAYLAGHMAKVWIERIARLPVEIEIASEFRYREPPLDRGGVTLVVSQSGETADTLAALRFAKEAGQRVLALVNVTSSSMAREADVVLPIHAGPEIGVASTKAFTAQILCLAALAVEIGRKRGAITSDQEEAMVDLLTTVPRRMAEAIAREPDFVEAARRIAGSETALFLGRGLMYPLALEGALKLKEITYIHAEGYAAGELKHGPIALVDRDLPIVALAPSGPHFSKMASNVREVLARHGRIILITDEIGQRSLGDLAEWTVRMPVLDEVLTPFSYAVAVQMIAYHAAVMRGTDVDQPRNLAKSVTVE